MEILAGVIIGIALLVVVVGLLLLDTGFLNLYFFALFLCVAVLLGVILTTGAVVLEELSFRRYPKVTDLLMMIAAGFLVNLGYRQLTMLWRIKGTWDYLRGNTSWGRMERRGFAKT